MFKITAKSVKEANEPGYYRDSELRGFCLKVTQTSKIFLVNTKVKGSRSNVTVTIGTYPLYSPEDARQEARDILFALSKGINPNERKREAKAAEDRLKSEAAAADAINQLTLKTVLDEYLSSRDLKENTKYVYRCTIHSALADWVDLPIVSITKDMVERRHREKTQQGHKGAANHVMRILRALISYAMAKYEDAEGKPIIAVNPVKRLTQARIWNRLSRRQSVIKAHELNVWCSAVYHLEDKLVRDYLLFVLFTGLRKNEAAQLKWKDVDLKANTILIEDPKNRQPHMLPLTDFLHELLLNRWQNKYGPYVFWAENSKQHLLDVRWHIDLVEEESGVKFMLHDLRRTFLTIADLLDISSYAIKKLANHKMTADVTAGYIISDVERLREPMNMICDSIMHHAGLESYIQPPKLVKLDKSHGSGSLNTRIKKTDKQTQTKTAKRRIR